jgi:hypothetical protein
MMAPSTEIHRRIADPGGWTMHLTTSSIPVPPSAVPVPLPDARSPRRTPVPDPITIDCGDCVHQQTSMCDDCVVSFIVGRQPEDAVVVDADQARAVRMLERAGLVPGVRHSRQVS